MVAEILCVGTELLLGNIVNTNAVYLSRELASLGIFVYYQSVVGDNPGRLKISLDLALSRSDMVVITGGLGPTYDDLTKETVAKAFGLEMEMHIPSLERLKRFFEQFRRDKDGKAAVMTPNNEKQAMMPVGATVFTNNYGTAPALSIEKNGKIVIMLPGPPREMEPIWREEIAPFLAGKSGKTLYSKTIHLFGIGESAAEHSLKEIMESSLNPTVAPYAKEGEVELRVTASGDTEQEAIALINPLIERIRGVLGQYFYGINVKSLQNAVVTALKAKNITLATAESCTGGTVGKRITEIAGSSEVYLGGAVTYANEAKIKLIGVNPATIERYGAVSAECAAEMARGVAVTLGADIGVSTTGIAGPGGGTNDKPVGLVYVGIYYKGETRTVKLNLARNMYRDEREMIRYIAASHALREVLREIE
ncbi:putative competence-damage inducible protein [Clostridia bacterium]|nr:putative competence-damage inducible protein [Clostridia bacterium]